MKVPFVTKDQLEAIAANTLPPSIFTMSGAFGKTPGA